MTAEFLVLLIQGVASRFGTELGEAYDETADGYIQVHHLETVSQRGGKYEVDPIKHLRPICPNCHAVVHLQDPPLGIPALKRMLKGAQSLSRGS